MYTNYDYYLNVYMGSIENDDVFDRLLPRAEKQIDRVTFGRLKPGGPFPFSKLDPDDRDAVQYAVCEVIDRLYEAQESGTKRVSSVTNGNYSESYFDDGGSVEGDILTVAIENLPYWMIELDAEWRMP